jgi:hypothetical protein
MQLKELLLRLDDAAAVYDRPTLEYDREPDDEAPPPLWQREGSKMSLEAILEYLRPHSDDNIRLPLLALLGALDDADGGRINSLTKPTKRPKSSSRTPIEDSARAALAAVTMDLMMQNGSTEDAAAKAVAPLIGLGPNALKTRRDKFASYEGEKHAGELYRKWKTEWSLEYKDDLDTFIKSNMEKLH